LFSPWAIPESRTEKIVPAGIIVAELRIMRQGHDPGQQIERICKEALEFDK
jgi:hypothetical protein